MKNWHTLAQKNIWVTGGAGYLGSAITRALDAAGARTLCLDLPGKAEALIRQHDLRLTTAASFDLTDVAGLPRFIEQCAHTHGVPDGLVHLAFASSAGQRLEELTAGDFQQTFADAVSPAFVLSRGVAQLMKTRGSGSVVLFASMYGMVAPDPRVYREPMTPNPIDYGASKAAVLQLARYLAAHYGPSGIRFNCVTPGPFPNPAIQASHPGFIEELRRKTMLGRIGTSSEVVGPTLFLLSDSAAFVTGHSLVVDGGWTAW
ncbi:MAG: SDR family oxidoreductase [Lacunisphaera sp.]|nr:SDR family oxidoreductase [Lacunisphaera sp.]